MRGILYFSISHQVYPFCVFLSSILFIVIANSISMRRLESFKVDCHKKVSILVPARNEERNIEGCVLSLLSQDHPDFEVIVLDDSSTDRTLAILSQLSSKDKRLKVIKGQALPKGWTGKNWACHQLAQAAEGEVLLFTDADTEHAAGSASSAAKALSVSGAGLISGMVRQKMVTAGELLTVPVMNWAVMCFMPLFLAHKLPSPALSAACGQFMAFSRQAYFTCGGHEAIKGKVLDDGELARLIKKSGMKALLYDATGLVSCRMYTGFKEAVGGFSKNLFAVFRNSAPIYVFLWTWLLFSMLVPTLFLLAGSGVGMSKYVLPAATSAFLTLMIWAFAFAKAKVPIWLSALYPILMPLWFYLAMRSMLMVALKRTSWKGRAL